MKHESTLHREVSYMQCARPVCNGTGRADCILDCILDCFFMIKNAVSFPVCAVPFTVYQEDISGKYIRKIYQEEGASIHHTFFLESIIR